MNLQPLYNVKKRLRASAIAGVGLLDEDFRLKRAVQELEPLSAAGAVFAKLQTRLDALLSAPPERRAGALLDALALTDAILYTQGRTGIEGDLASLPPKYGKYVPLSYEQIRSLTEALTTQVSGRCKTLSQTFGEHPDSFTDYRILPKVIDALGDRNAEVGDLCVEILSAQGEQIIPLLKKDFDPAGKQEMQWRAYIITNMAEESEWILSQLPKAKRDVRYELLLALGKNAENVPHLLEFAKKERGRNREAVLSALGAQDCDTPQMRAFWEDEVTANGEAVRFLSDNNADWISDLAAKHLRQCLERVLEQRTIEDEKQSHDLKIWINETRKRVLPGMEALWLWIDEHFDALESVEDRSGKCEWKRVGEIGTTLVKNLFYMLCERGELSELCLRLYRMHPDSPRYVSHGLIASLLTKDAAEVYEEFSPMILAQRPLQDHAEKQKFHDAVLFALHYGVYWSREKKTHYIRWGGEFQTFRQPLDSRWIDRLLHCPGGDLMYAQWNGGCGVGLPEQIEALDHLIVAITNPDDAQMSETVAAYLRRRMAETGQWLGYCAGLLHISKSPRGALKQCFTKKHAPPNHCFKLWEMLDEASKRLPAAEVIAIIEEILEADWFLPVDEEAVPQGRIRDGEYPFWSERTAVRSALKDSAERLERGEPFPSWMVWEDM